jgi:transcriptional regulator with XRE-family HTH domain
MTIMIRPEVPLQVITPELVRASISRARRSLEKAAEEIIWQIEREAWRTLGYSSWTAMREAEYGGAAFMVPSKNRPELIARIRAAGLTQREIAATAGVSQQQVSNDLRVNTTFGNEHRSVITNSRGQQRPASYSRAEPEVVDAEIVEEDEPIYINEETGEVIDDLTATSDPAPVESACPTCHGTGKVTS